MSGTERQLGIVKDVILSLDYATRYDLVFTDRRVAIVCMGRSDRVDSVGSGYSPLTGIAPTTPGADYQKRINKVVLEDEVSNLSIDERLRLSKKSCFYTYDEIEEVKLVLSRKPKFVILSEECESKFAPNQEQIAQLIDTVPKIGALRSKLFVGGNWNVLQEIFRTQSQS